MRSPTATASPPSSAQQRRELVTIGIHIDRIDRTDIDTEHAVDAGRLAGGIGLAVAFGMAGRVDPIEDIHRAMFETVA